MRHVVFLTAILLSATSALGQDWEGDLLGLHGKLHGSVGVAWDSQYIWRGFDVYHSDSAVDVLADMALWGTGFGVSAVGHQSLSESFGDLQRWDGTFYYQNSLYPGAPLATNVRLGYVYYYYPKMNEGRTEDLMEVHAILSWPNLLPLAGLQPSYAAAYMWPGARNPWAEDRNPHFADNATGLFHIAMLDYAFTVPALLSDADSQVVKLHSELVYNDGVSPFGTRVKAGFSNVVLGASTDFVFGANRNIILTPALYYQFSLEDTVNPDDEFWVSVSLKYPF